MTLLSDQIRAAFAKLLSERIAFPIDGCPTVYIRRPNFADVWQGGDAAELIQRHTVTAEGFPVFRDAKEVRELLPGLAGVALFEAIQRLYEASANPPTPSGGSSPSLGSSG